MTSLGSHALLRNSREQYNTVMCPGVLFIPLFRRDCGELYIRLTDRSIWIATPLINFFGISFDFLLDMWFVALVAGNLLALARERQMFKAAIETLKLEGIKLTARDGEYRVAHMADGKRDEGCAYYTCDLDDAIASGLAMARARRESDGERRYLGNAGCL